ASEAYGSAQSNRQAADSRDSNPLPVRGFRNTQHYSQRFARLWNIARFGADDLRSGTWGSFSQTAKRVSERLGHVRSANHQRCSPCDHNSFRLPPAYLSWVPPRACLPRAILAPAVTLRRHAAIDQPDGMLPKPRIFGPVRPTLKRRPGSLLSRPRS